MVQVISKQPQADFRNLFRGRIILHVRELTSMFVGVEYPETHSMLKMNWTMNKIWQHLKQLLMLLKLETQMKTDIYP